MSGERRAWLLRWLPDLAHLACVLWLFEGALLGGKTLYFRDILYYYYPNYVFLARALGQWVWPLWNPACDAGSPFLIVYPLDLLLVAMLGPALALGVGVALHVFLAMAGATRLARELGSGPWGGWLAGVGYGLSGFLLSAVNLFELLHAAAWAPWVVAAVVRLVRAPSRRGIAVLAALAALQVSTLSAETVLATGLLALVLAGLPTRRAWVALLLAGALASVLAAPALLGARSLVEGTRRQGGFSPAESLAWSAPPVVLVDAVLPRFFGDAHSFSEAGYWGQSLFTGGYPYLISLYLGLPLLLLAACAGPGQRGLWLLVALGGLWSLGSHGPLGPALLLLTRSFRAPVKLFLLVALPLSLLAGRGLDRGLRTEGARRSAWALLPGSVLLAAGLLLARWPAGPARLFGGLIPELRTWQAELVVGSAWPSAFLVSGALAVGVALARWAGPRLAPLGGLLVALDLLIVNTPLNPQVDWGFYALRRPIRALVGDAEALGRHRWFSFGAADAPGLRWSPAVSRRNSDLALYAVDRQVLLPRTHLLDGVEGAFDEDRVGWAPEGSTLAPEQRDPSRFRDLHARLRLANVRWVLSFFPLPADLATARGQATLAEVIEPLGLYELRDPLPRAFWVPRAEVISDRGLLRRRSDDPGFDPRAVVLLESSPGPPVLAPTSPGGSPGIVAYELLDPHTVRVRCSGPPGYVVVLDGYHRDWRAYDEAGPVALFRANGRYRAVSTTGGDRAFMLRYQPRWRGPALAACFVGLLALAALALPGGPARPETPSRP